MKISWPPNFFFCWLKLSIITPELFIISRYRPYICTLRYGIRVRTNEQIQCKESSENDENNKENIIPHGFFVSRLLINIGNIDGIIHDIHPTFECGDLKQCKQTNHWIIKCNLAIHPSISSICNRLQIKANFPEWLCNDFDRLPRRPRFESWQWQKFIFKLNFLTARIRMGNK